jgi:membrane fusion protein (multidrug efflux system)
VVEVVQKDVPVFMEVVGQTKGSQDVEIRARVEGYLEKFFFTEGAFVQKGDKLYQIDPKPFQATVAQSKANLATVQARLDQATIMVNRLTPLVAQNAVSRQELDNATADQDAARAQVDAGRASLDKATLDLGYTNIVSPIDGVVAKKSVELGQVAQIGQPLLAIVPLHDVWVVANFKETQLGRMRPGMRAGKCPPTHPTVHPALPNARDVGPADRRDCWPRRPCQSLRTVQCCGW